MFDVINKVLTVIHISVLIIIIRETIYYFNDILAFFCNFF